MLINALRFRDDGGPWTSFRVSSGTGRFRNYACITGPADTLRRALAAVTLALTGRVSALISETELSLSDDAGHAWTIRRVPGQTRILRDGKELPAATAERQLLGALLDADLSVATQQKDAEHGADVQNIRIIMEDDGLRIAPTAERGLNPADTLRGVAERQIREIAQGCAASLNRKALENPALLARLARILEPLHASYRELCAQYREVKDKSPDSAPGSVVKSAPDADAASLRAELLLIREIAQAAEALLKPGASIKAWRDELAAIEARLADIAATHNLDDAAQARFPDDLRKPIDALAKHEAHTRLIRAAQAARKQCESDVEPLLRNYWDLISTSLDKDEQIARELESCLQAFGSRLAAARAREASHQHMDLRDGGDGLGIKTWFDRFRTKQQEEMEGDDGTVADLEGVRSTVAFALKKLRELSHGLQAVKPKFAGTLKRFDDAHEDLVRSYGKSKEEWLQVAKESGLPETMTLDALLKLVSDHARLNSLMQKRAELQEKIRDASARMARLSRLVPEWRQVAGSQKASDLSNPQLLLQEARDIIRYQEPKERRLAQLGESCSAQSTQNNLKTVLKTRRKAMLARWREVFIDAGIEPIDINSENLPEALRRASLVRALGLVVGSSGKTIERDPFAAAMIATTTGRSCAASAYLIEEDKTTNPARLALLSALEDAHGTELRILLVADEALAAMLGTLGIGIAQKAASPREEAPSAPPTIEAARPRPSVIPAHRGPQTRPDTDTRLPPTRGEPSLRSPARIDPATRPTTRIDAPRPAESPMQRADQDSIPAPGPVPQTITASGRAVPAPLLTEKARHALGLLTGKKN